MIHIKGLIWQNDFNGYEVGYEKVDVVGLYKSPKENTYFYIDTETRRVLEKWEDEEEL